MFKYLNYSARALFFSIAHLPEQSPDSALVPYNPERAVHIRFVTHIMMGGVHIYRL
jgi:hypothetical protein